MVLLYILISEDKGVHLIYIKVDKNYLPLYILTKIINNLSKRRSTMNTNPHIKRNVIVISGKGVEAIHVPVEKQPCPGAKEILEAIELMKKLGYPELPVIKSGGTGYLNKFNDDEVSGYGIDEFGRMFIQFTKMKTVIIPPNVEVESDYRKVFTNVTVRIFERYDGNGPLVSCETGGPEDIFKSAITRFEWTGMMNLLKDDVKRFTNIEKPEDHTEVNVSVVCFSNGLGCPCCGKVNKLTHRHAAALYMYKVNKDLSSCKCEEIKK
jgi:hypothetical protein